MARREIGGRWGKCRTIHGGIKIRGRIWLKMGGIAERRGWNCHRVTRRTWDFGWLLDAGPLCESGVVYLLQLFIVVTGKINMVRRILKTNGSHGLYRKVGRHARGGKRGRSETARGTR
jgi:hypothetical protein